MVQVCVGTRPVADLAHGAAYSSGCLGVGQIY